MNKNKIKWILLLSIPILLILPFNQLLLTGKYFRSIIIQPQKTGITTFNFYDDTRQRPVVTEVWYPVDLQVPAKPSTGIWVRCDEAREAPISSSQQKFPLIVISHGLGGDRFTVSWIAEILAANGYIVAAMDHYGNTWNNKIPEFYVKSWERPRDISFVLDQMLANPLFKDRIDEKKIGVAGYSLGGATAIWIAGAELTAIPYQELGKICLREMPGIVTEEVIAKINFEEAQQSFLDPRVNAVFAMAPALCDLFHENSLKAIKIPTFIIATVKDQIVPFEKNASVFAKKISKATLKVFNNEADHYVFNNRATLVGKRLIGAKWCEDPPSVNRKEMHEEIGKTAVEFFDKHLN